MASAAAQCCPPANVIIASNVLNTNGNVIAANIIAVDGFFSGNLTVTGNIISNIVYTSLNVTGTVNAVSVVAQQYLGNGYGLSNLNASNLTGLISNTNLIVTGVSPGQYGSFSNVGTFTVDQYGRLTQASNVPILSSQWTTVAGNVAYQNGVSIGTLSSPPVGSNLLVLGTANIDTLNVTTLFANSATIFGPMTLNVYGVSNLNTVIASLYTGNASGLSNLPASNIVGTVPSASIAGSVTQGYQPNITSVQTLSAQLFTGNASGLSNVQGSNIVGTVSSATIAGSVTQGYQPNITSVQTLSAQLFTGNASGLSNINASNIAFGIVNSSLILGNTLSNIQASNIVGFQTGNAISNINASNLAFGVLNSSLILGNTLSNLNASNLFGNVASANSALVVTQSAQPNITSVGTLTSLSVTGGVSASTFSGSGAGLTDIPGTSITGNVASANSALVVTQSAQPNITSVGTLSSLTVSGGIAASTFSGSGAALSLLNGSNVTGNVASSNAALVVTQSAQPNITSVGTLTSLSVTGGVSASTFTGSGSGLTNVPGTSISGTVSSATVAGSVTYPTQSNITGLGTLTNLTVTGSVIGGTFVGDGAGLTYLNPSALNGPAPTALSVTLAAQANITSVGTLTGLTVAGILNANLHVGNASALSNINGSNVSQVPLAAVAGVVTAPYQPNVTALPSLFSYGLVQSLGGYAGNGSGLSNLNSSNLFGNVASSNAALVVTQAAQPNITSLGTLTSLNVFSGVSNLVSIVSPFANITTIVGTYYGPVAGSNIASFSNVTTTNLVASVANVGTLNVLSISNLFSLTTNLVASTANVGTLNVLTISNLNSLTTNLVASVANVGTLNVLTISNLNSLSTNLIASTANVGTLNVLTISNLNSLSTNLIATTANVGTLNVLTISNLSSLTTNLFATTANVGTLNVLTISNLNSLTTNLFATTANVGTLNVGQIANLSSLTTNLIASTANVGTLNVLTISNLNSLTTNLIATTANVGTLNVFSISNLSSLTTNLIATTANVGTLNVLTISNLSSLSTNLIATTANVGTLNVLTISNLSSLTTNLIASTVNVGTLNVLTISNLSSLTTNLIASTANVGTLNVFTISNLASLTTNLIATTANVGTLNVLTISNLNSLTTNLNATTANVGTLNVLTISNLSSLTTNLIASTANVGTLNVLQISNLASLTTNLIASTANVGTLNVLTISNLSSLTTNLLASVANITTLNVSSLATVGNLTVVSNIIPNSGGNTYAQGNLVVSGNVYSSLGQLGAGGGYLFSLPGDIALQTPYTGALYGTTYPLSVGLSNGFTINGTSTLITVTSQGNFRFSVAGPYLLRAVFNSSDNIKGLALGSNVADTHGTDQAYLYRYTTFITQNPTELIEIPFNVTDISKYYYLDLFSVGGGGALYQTANTSGGTYLTITPLQGGGLATGGPGGTPGTQWISSGSNIYFPNSVGVGAVNPAYNLDVSTGTTATKSLVVSNISTLVGTQYLNVSSNVQILANLSIGSAQVPPQITQPYSLYVTGQGYFSNHVSYENFSGYRNRLINGTFRVASRANALVVSNTYSNVYWNTWSQDRWHVDTGNLATSNVSLTIKQDVPLGQTNGFTNVSNVSVQRVMGSVLDNTWHCPLVQTMESTGTYDLGFGQNTAKPFVVSFYANAYPVGNYSVVVRSKQDNTYFANLISLTNSWNRYSVLIPPCTIGSWGTGTDGSVEVCLLGVSFGSVRANVAATNTWTASPGYPVVGVTGAVNWMATAGAFIQITGVQLELGTITTPFEIRLLSDTVRYCQRYFETNPDTQYASALGSGRVSSVPFVVTKRDHANVTVYTTLSNLSANTNISRFTAYYGDGTLANFSQTVNSYIDSDYGFSFNFTNTGSKFMDGSIMEAQFVWKADAEIY